MRSGTAFLAAGPAHRLPYPSYSVAVQRVVVRALLKAWDVVRNHTAARTTPRREVPITIELQQELNRMLDTDNDIGFTASVFETVIRGGETENMDRTSPERRPDLTFRLVGAAPANTMREHCAMFAECKLLDATHTLRGYCDTGLRRFVDCEYAWAMSHALMLAYALPTATPVELAAFLCSRDEYRTIGDLFLNIAPQADGLLSIHGRQRNAVDSESGPIEITHVWLPLVSGEAPNND
jgi:hypothetical protein